LCLCSEVITSSATNLAEVLADLWDKIVVLKEAPKEKSIVLAFPSVKALASPTAVNRLLAHMDICKDACDDFGSEVKLIGVTPITPHPLHPCPNPPRSQRLVRLVNTRYTAPTIPNPQARHSKGPSATANVRDCGGHDLDACHPQRMR
jgi:hypothetical protein